MPRRGLLPGLLGGLAAIATVCLAPAPAQAQRSRKPPALEITKQPSIPQPTKSGTLPQSSLAPIPDRNREGPRVVEEDRARLNPSIINRNMPGRGQVDQGSPDLLEEKLFRPAPGVRLQAPFSY
ncbi:hypothetical protein [Paracraurococcus ruber]|uniref:Uncharacterized protein n=1 Tax=Paracraurococcus ruber TaxID=77675 RepID=A0ABS1D6X0_9PROT|nr:hypothetical protein [Paracraurococcus ruber]MBK1662075.1 hypothetical protein [Paracraurococcus ruber]TDG29114.1 hypothetical protein E2C05_18770 [Paracraurococcus ruber]